MAEDRVTMYREELVGDEVSLQSFNPKSNTESIDNSETGESLQNTLNRIWNDINNRLSRITNSVNGRTGVVVLKSEDVGLGKVDNVSYAEIKKWVIDYLSDAFSGRSLLLFHSFTELEHVLATGDKNFDGVAYYIESLNSDDTRAYIGFLSYNASDESLSFNQLPINTIGFTDNSIIYNENIREKTMEYGGIAVNIYPYEDALKLYNGLTKEESGLYIDKSKLCGKVKYYTGVYGQDGLPNETNTFLYSAISPPVTTPTISIYIDNQLVPGINKIKDTSLNFGDLVICDFRDYMSIPFTDTTGTYHPSSRRETNTAMPYNVNWISDLMGRNTAIGMITSAPTLADPSLPYRIDFYSIKPHKGYGMEYVTTHQDGINNDTISMHLLEANYDLRYYDIEKNIVYHDTRIKNNSSGLQTYQNVKDGNPTDFESSILPTRPASTPIGSHLMSYTRDLSSGIGPLPSYGLTINPDLSLCVMPYEVFGEYVDENMPNSSYTNSKGVVRPYGSRCCVNWAATAPDDFSNNGLENGALTDSSMIGINVEKIVSILFPTTDEEYLQTHCATKKLANTSGLRVSKQFNTALSPTYFGMNYNENPIWTDYHPLIKGYLHEGSFYYDNAYSSLITPITNDPMIRYIDIPSNGVYQYTESEYVITDRTPENINTNVHFGLSTSITSGGLSVNVGSFLEIFPGNYNKSAITPDVYPNSVDDFYDGGKINVRIGKGLMAEPDEFDTSGCRIKGNRIQIGNAANSGLGFDQSGKLIVGSQRIQFKDSSGNNVALYNPLGKSSTGQQNGYQPQTLSIKLGEGLTIVTDPDTGEITIGLA